MEIALPHVLVRICGPGVGPSLVAALGLHPVEVSEARDASEVNRIARGRPPVLVVITDPPDPRAAILETWNQFHQTPILIVGPPATAVESLEPPLAIADAAAGKGWVDSVPGDLDLADICWQVMEAVSRAARLESVVEHPIGPVLLEVDDDGRLISDPAAVEGLLVDGRRLAPGESLLNLVDPADRNGFAESLRPMRPGEVRFGPLRLLDGHGGSHAVSAGTRQLEAGRHAVLMQPLISGGPIVGRHINDRDPITGLLTRWAMSRRLESLTQFDAAGSRPVVVVLKLDNFMAISEYIGHDATDAVLVRVAAALSGALTHPAFCSRVMGDTFLACLPEAGVDEAVRSTEQVIAGINAIDVPGFSAGFQLQASAGVAAVSRHDYDFAVQLADAAVATARAAGGNRAIVAGVASATSVAGDLAAAMEMGSWEVWLQPVVGQAGGHPVFHEALARFQNGHGHVIPRPEFFLAGRAQGLLEQFDLAMLQRVLQILAAHPDEKFSVNVSFETFMSEAFPASFLGPLQAAPDGCRRIILEIAPRCLAMPAAGVRSRLDALAAAGVAVAVDDFGSGLCRLRQLTQHPLAIVKLDALVTSYIDDDPLQRDFVRTVVSICRARGIATVAEYTRSQEQMTRLVDDGVDWFQGELVGMPAPAAEVFASASVGAATA